MIPAPVYWSVLAACSCATTIDDIRLVGGHSATQGRVEVKVDGVWGTICDRNWNQHDAMVTCRSVGLLGGTTKTGAFFGQGSGPIHLKDVVCAGGEASLASCLYGQEKGQCRHSDDVGVVCISSHSAITQHVHPPIHSYDSHPRLSIKSEKKKLEQRHIINVANKLTKDTNSEFTSDPVNIRLQLLSKNPKYREKVRSMSSNTVTIATTQLSAFVGFTAADASPAPTPRQARHSTNIKESRHARHITNITEPRHARRSVNIIGNLQTTSHYSTHTGSDKEQARLPTHSVYRRQAVVMPFPTNNTLRNSSYTSTFTTKKPIRNKSPRSPSGWLIAGLVLGAFTVAGMVIAGAWYYQNEPRGDKDKMRIPRWLAALGKRPSKGILRPKSSYGGKVRTDLGKDNTLEENTDMNAERNVDVNVILGIVPSSSSSNESDLSSEATTSTATSDITRSTTDSQTPVSRRESLSEMYLRCKL